MSATCCLSVATSPGEATNRVIIRTIENQNTVSVECLMEAGMLMLPEPHWNIQRIDDQPRGQQLAHGFFLPYPSDRQFIGMCEMELYAIDFNYHSLQYGLL